jgi:alpha-L-fucosidase 2
MAELSSCAVVLCAIGPGVRVDTVMVEQQFRRFHCVLAGHQSHIRVKHLPCLACRVAGLLWLVTLMQAVGAEGANRSPEPTPRSKPDDETGAHYQGDSRPIANNNAVNQYDVIWTSPSQDSSGSMPIGNGDLALNVWVEKSGDLLFYIAKADAFSENDQLLKLGRVRVKLTPSPIGGGTSFKQELRSREGEIVVEAGEPGQEATLRVWVDACRPVVHVEAQGPRPFAVQAAVELWRTERRKPLPGEEFALYELNGSPDPLFIDPDTVLPARSNQIVWCHRNERSCFPATFTNQHLGSLLAKYHDPLLHRTFGCLMKGPGLVAADNLTLKSAQPARKHRLSIYALTAQTDTPTAWTKQLDETVTNADATDLEPDREAHRQWWAAFWDRSWIHIRKANTASLPAPTDEAQTVSRGYALSRWMTACAGRGALPMKFNGSLFTVDAQVRDPATKTLVAMNTDYRAWGGNYWFQNQRLIYWPMLAAGDFDLMEPWWKMYRDALPLARDRTRLYYGHDGAYFFETMCFWGTANNNNFGWGSPANETRNTYIRYYWQGGIELTAMMLDRYEFTGDREFAARTLLPVASEVMTFYDQHYHRDATGRIRFEPAQSLETWQATLNPMPEIAGLKYVVPRLLALPRTLTTELQRETWQRLLADLPPVPVKTENGKQRLLPAETYSQEMNMEGPELYAVYPYRLYGLGKPELELAMNAFEARKHQDKKHCWWQHGIWAAHLGLADAARDYVLGNFTALDGQQRFPAFWKASPDWVPDMDNGGVGMITLQAMLLQADGRTIRLLPAWPEDWDCDFKLHTSRQTVVEATVVGGKVAKLKVTPEERRKDVALPVDGAQAR